MTGDFEDERIEVEMKGLFEYLSLSQNRIVLEDLIKETDKFEKEFAELSFHERKRKVLFEVYKYVGKNYSMFTRMMKYDLELGQEMIDSIRDKRDFADMADQRERIEVVLGEDRDWKNIGDRVEQLMRYLKNEDLAVHGLFSEVMKYAEGAARENGFSDEDARKYACYKVWQTSEGGSKDVLHVYYGFIQGQWWKPSKK